MKYGSTGLPENYILVKLSERLNLGMARHNVINIAQANTNLNFSHCTKAVLFYVCHSRDHIAKPGWINLKQ